MEPGTARTAAEVRRYIATAAAAWGAGTEIPFATVRAMDGEVIGSTGFWNIERWAWPEGHARHGRRFPDACEIGYTWVAPAAIRSGINTSAKLLMLTHPFEVWQVLRVCFHTDSRNSRSRAALERFGARYEGILRAPDRRGLHRARFGPLLDPRRGMARGSRQAAAAPRRGALIGKADA